MLVERSPGTASEAVGDRSLIVDPDGRSVVTLSPTGSIVWEAIDGERDLDALARALADRTTGSTFDQARRDVAAFVSELLEAGLVRRRDAPG